MKLFVSNLRYEMTEQDVRDLFAEIGQVVSFHVARDRATNQSRGFAFVEMSEEDGNKAISELNKTKVRGRTLFVREAEERRQ